MHKFSIQVDPLTGEKFIDVPYKGHLLVENPLFNKGSAFSEMEREQLDLYGIFPPQVSTLDLQLRRAYENFVGKPSPVEKFIYLLSLLDRNETLHYGLVLGHLEEMLPIVYTPTVGEGAKTFSLLFRRPRGLYVAANRIHLIDRILESVPFSNISLVVATDGERILGLGDQGVGGMAIPIGKVSLYVVGAGLPPALCLPVLIDVGTNNEELLQNPLYMGLKHRRLTGEAYDNVVEEFAKGVKRHFPHALLQWEDFGKHNALRLLNNYRERICSFDDDIQGTGAIALATMYSAITIKKEQLKDQRYLFFGFGQAGYGIATTLVTALCEEGLSLEQAKERIFPVDKDGLITQGMAADEYQQPFVCSRDMVGSWKCRDKKKIDLLDTVANAGITVIIGVSGVAGAFTDDVLSQLVKNSKQPVVLALSNPTHKSECTPEQAFKATEGRCLMATGSPFAPVKTAEGLRVISQCNNMYVFPGVGLGAMISMTPRVTDQMFIKAAKAVAAMVDKKDLARGALLPDIKDIRKVSENVAYAVAMEARDSVLGIRLYDGEMRTVIRNSMWQPEYLPYRYNQ
ncbi:NAD-dependent malic enzyme [candidate division WOR-3 bacterium]|nr:NAD-dependent malic enzyme [candidate division WOR-3 bacterium]